MAAAKNLRQQVKGAKQPAKTTKRFRLSGERGALAALILVTLLIRVPFVSRFEFVAFDGTYYINQAKALLHGSFSGGAFPLGYPLLIAPMLVIVRDGVLAAALVSLLAAIGSVLLLYAIARRHVSMPAALGAGLILAAVPLFIDASLVTLSESAYLFWVLLSLWYFGADKHLRSGLAIGMAAATRPEALAVAGILGLFRIRAPRKLAAFALAFVLVYGASVAALSIAHQRLTLLSRGGAFKSVSTSWFMRDTSVDYRGRERVEKRLQEKEEPFNRGRSYARRLPLEVGRLANHALPALPGLALLILLWRRERYASRPVPPWYVLAAFAPLPFIPLFTDDRGIVRWLVPYVPAVILFGVIGLSLTRTKREQRIAWALTAACAVFSLVINQRNIGREIENDLSHTRDAARRFANKVQPGDAIADRKPYFPFYAGARYIEIPNGPYDAVLAHLAALPVRFIAVQPTTVMVFRPAMRPLVYDKAVVTGEMRYRQAQFETSGEIVYERVEEKNPLISTQITTPETADHSPAWSPDGSIIAFRRHFSDDTSAIMLTNPEGSRMRELVRTGPILDAMAWSPDGSQLAYTSFVDGRMVISVCDVQTGKSRVITGGGAPQWNPSWCRDTGAFAFCTEEMGARVANLATRAGQAGTRVSDQEAADFVSISPNGSWISWVDPPGHLVLSNLVNGEMKKAREPAEILSEASWSPDGRFVLVEAFDWGAPNLYMIDVETGRSLRVTGSDAGAGMPSWSPRGGEVVAVSSVEAKPALWLHSNLRPYVERLLGKDDVQTFVRPKETRRDAPPGARRFR